MGKIKCVWSRIEKLIHAVLYWPSGKVAEYMFNNFAFQRYQKELEMKGYQMELVEDTSTLPLFHNFGECQQNNFEEDL